MTTTHRGHEIDTYRDENARDSAQFPHEIGLRVDGEKVITATELERMGCSYDEVENWHTALGIYALAYIDGMEDGQ